MHDNGEPHQSQEQIREGVRLRGKCSALNLYETSGKIYELDFFFIVIFIRKATLNL